MATLKKGAATCQTKVLYNSLNKICEQFFVHRKSIKQRAWEINTKQQPTEGRSFFGPIQT